jgi:hypothetical protein
MPFQWNADSNADASVADAHGYSHSYRVTQPYTDGYSDRYAYRYCYSYFNCNSYCYRYGHCHGQANADRAPAAHTETTTHTAAASLRVGDHSQRFEIRVRVAHAPRVLVSASRRNELSWRFVAGFIERSPRWRGRHRQHAGRVRYPRERLFSDRDDIVGLTRYVHSGKRRIDEFTSHNTASTRARFGENSQTGSVAAAFPVSNAA